MQRILLIAFTLVIGAAADIGAQTRAESLQTSPELFVRLFRDCPDCSSRGGAVHMVIDSPRLTDSWLARHARDANGSSFGDNAAIADLWYDSVHRRLFTRSLVLHEVNDPADLRLGRAPGIFPSNPDFRSTLPPGTTVGHVGFVPWTHNGFGSYFAAVQGAIRDGATGYLDFSTATGEEGVTRTGSRYRPEDLIKHVRLHPSGQLEVGFETDPAARPDAALVVRGNVEIEGSLIVGSTEVGQPSSPPTLSCGVRRAGASGRGAAVSCGPGERATGGGGVCAAGEMRGTRPLVTADAPSGWEVTCSREGPHSAYVICCAR